MLLQITDREGTQHEVEVQPAGLLMEALRDLDYGVLAICGGSCACATCHVYVAPDWVDRLPQQHADERELINELEHRRNTSRLSCQIRLTQELHGICLTLAPEE